MLVKDVGIPDFESDGRACPYLDGGVAESKSLFEPFADEGPPLLGVGFNIDGHEGAVEHLRSAGDARLKDNLVSKDKTRARNAC